MKKKLILLIALMNSPKILLMDEPFRGLDLETVDFFKNYLKELHSEGLTLVISSHILEELENFCQEVIVLNQGKLNKILSIEEIKMQELRVINTTDNSRVEEILSIYSIPYNIVGTGIKVDIKDSKWEEVYKEISSNGIMISSMEDVSTLKESINSTLRGGNRSEF
jgi:ABC-2 type transport system ATP-binding protein